MPRSPLKTSHIEQYWRELTDGNFGMRRFMVLAARGFIMEIARRVGLLNRSRCEVQGANLSHQSRLTFNLATSYRCVAKRNCGHS
jgi:hypothetical protein